LHPITCVCPREGCSSRWFSVASLLNNSRPSESASSRPIGYTPLGNPNSASVRFGEPSGVNCDTTPKGLWKAISTRAGSRERKSRASRKSFRIKYEAGRLIVLGYQLVAVDSSQDWKLTLRVQVDRTNVRTSGMEERTGSREGQVA
jgi:hypothetical protein